MGYASYLITRGPLKDQMGGYNHEGFCCHPGCFVVCDRSVSELCGFGDHYASADPHGGNETSCGCFFCDAHLHYVADQRGQRCEACSIPCPACAGQGWLEGRGDCPTCEGRGRFIREEE